MFEFQPEIIVLATLLISLVLFATDAISHELVALLIVLAMALTGCLRPEEAFRGFASPAVVLIGSMYVFGHAVARWGVAESLGQRLFGETPRNEAILTFRICLFSGLLSAFLSNTGVVAALIPVLSTISRRTRIPASKLYMPLAFGSLLGGMVTLIGTSSNVAIDESLKHQGLRGLGLFEFAPLGLCVLLLGSLYFLVVGRKLLPLRREGQSLSDHYQVRKFVTEVLVEPSSTLINRTVSETDLGERYGISVLGIVRPEAEATLAPGPYNRIRGEDTLILQGEPESIMRLRNDLGLKQIDSVQAGEMRLVSADVHLVEAVLPAGSRFIGQNLRDLDFRARTGLNVLALQKQGAVQLELVNRVQLEMGDTLLIQGHKQDIERTRREHELLILDEVRLTPIGPGALITLGLLALVVLLPLITPIALSVSALLGAVGLVLLGAVKSEDALRAVSWPVLILVGGMLALGDAFERYGLAARLAEFLAQMGSLTSDPRILIGAVLVSTVLLTQILNNVSTAVIMTPVAVKLAATLGLDERPFVIAVIFGTGMAFLSPVAHQANAMVAGPGDYRFRDFLRVGLPMVIIVGVFCLFAIPWFWPLQST